jgi:hypothetical protein
VSDHLHHLGGALVERLGLVEERDQLPVSGLPLLGLPLPR